jgi:hypothetical protein
VQVPITPQSTPADEHNGVAKYFARIAGGNYLSRRLIRMR